MGKVESRGARPEFFAKGGDGKMFEKGTAHPKSPGVSGKETNGGKGGKWAEGGSNHMFGKGHANKAESGQSGKTSQ